MRLKLALIGCVAVLATANAGHSAPKNAPRAEVLQKLLDCRAIPDNAARLTCYETQAANIEAAEAKKDVVVIDRGQAAKINKDNFGLSPAKQSALSGNVDDIEAKITRVNQLKSGKWFFVLDDGASWYQTEYPTGRDPKPGQPIRIRKAALGSFFANINGQKAVRVKRVGQP